MVKTGRDKDTYGPAKLKFFGGATPIILAPSIQNMRITEEKRQLEIFGQFGSEPGTVTVGTGAPQNPTWTPTKLTLNIPDTGAGSQGDVVVTVRGHDSNKVPLSVWEGNMKQTLISSVMFGTPGPSYVMNCSKLRIRVDAHAYRKEPGGTAVIGPLENGVIMTANATQNSTCTATLGGKGTKNRTEYTYAPAGTINIPWADNGHTPANPKPWFFLLWNYDTVTQRMRFILNYVSFFKLHTKDLDTGHQLDLDFFPLFNTGGVTLKNWYPFPTGTGVRVPISGGDTGTMDYDFTPADQPTADTES
jgi:hypothetical protein